MTARFFIVGAPKAGTTALWQYLRGHPRIFMPEKKEPHFFAEPSLRRRAGALDDSASLSEYHELFRDATTEHLAVGEASVYYMFSAFAASRIADFAPASRIIAVVRNPVDLFRSLHSHYLYNLTEDITDVQEAWAAQQERALGRNIPPECTTPSLLQYREVVRLGSQIERFLAVLDPEQIKVFLFEDFVAEPGSVYAEILQHIGVPHDGRTEFPLINPAKTLRSRTAMRLIQNAARRYKGMQSRVRIPPTGFGRQLMRLNTRPQHAPRTLHPDFARSVYDELREDIGILSTAIGRDLSGWEPR